MNLDFYEDIYNDAPIFEVKDLKKLANNLEKVVKEDSTYNAVEGFFSWALSPYYSPFIGPNDFCGITKNVGHIVYRLSDFISEEQRKNIPIYPGEDGTLLMKQLEGEVQWESLEDWRKSWEKEHSIIPNFIKKLPSTFKFLE